MQKNKKKLILKLEKEIETKQINVHNIIILGDLNFVTNNLDRNYNKLNSIDSQTNPVWENFENKINLLDAFRTTNPKRRLYSHTSKSDKN